MGGETLSDPIDESTGGNKIVSVPEATPLIAPMVKEEDSDDVINTGTISPDVIKASDDSGEYYRRCSFQSPPPVSRPGVWLD